MVGDLLSVAGLTVLIMLTPGADLALVTRNSVTGGRSGGWWTSLGILTGNLVHLTYCLLGIGWLIANSTIAFTTMKLAGGAYLVFLGLQGLRPSSSSDAQAAALPGRNRNWWLQGLLNNMLNPKGPLFYLGLLAVFVRPDSPIVYMTLLVVTTIGVSAAFWVLFLYVLQISTVRRQLLKAERWISRLLGTVLIVLGIRLWLSEAPD